MKKTQVALAALALMASTAALADGITLSGAIDIGAQNSSNGGTRMGSGLLGINVINLAGSEDLGNGLKADFFLQHRFEAHNGQSTYGTNTNLDGTGAGTTTFWNQSYVGLSGAFGSVKIGKQVDAYAAGVFGFDVTGAHNMGSSVSSLLFQGTSGVFVDNAIGYTTPTMSGLSASGTYINADTQGGCPGGACAKGDYSAVANYSDGALSIGGGYSKRKAEGMAGSGKFGGIGYDFGVAKVNLLYQTSDLNGSSTGVNASLPITGALTLWAGYYKDKVGNEGGVEGTTTAITALYTLSPRTRLFANIQSTTGDTTLNKGTSSTGAVADAGSKATTVGVAHSF